MRPPAKTNQTSHPAQIWIQLQHSECSHVQKFWLCWHRNENIVGWKRHVPALSAHCLLKIWRYTQQASTDHSFMGTVVGRYKYTHFWKLQDQTPTTQTNEVDSRNTNATLDLAIIFVTELQRENDQFIMDWIHEHWSQFTDTEVQKIQACRLYQGVTLLSDITNLAGTQIWAGVLWGVQPEENTFKGLMPYQDKPLESSWKLGRKVLAAFTTSPRSPILRTPLENWLVDGNNMYREWNIYKEHDAPFAYVRKYHQFQLFEQVQHNVFDDTMILVPKLPKHTTPVEAWFQDGHLVITTPTHSSLPIEIEEPILFLDYIQTLELWERELVRDIQFSGDVYTFVTSMQHAPTVYCTSECSAPNFIGSFSWVCSLPDGQRIARNKGPAFGFRTTSFWSEAYGLLSYLQLIYRAFEFTSNPLPQSLLLYSDAERALKKLRKMLEFTHCFQNLTLQPD